MGILSAIGDAIESVAATMESRLDPGTIISEMGAGLDKMAAQGAAEVGQALFAGNAYMPYGPTQTPITLAEDAPAPAQSPVEPSPGYQEMLDSYAPPSTPVVQQETEMQR